MEPLELGKFVVQLLTWFWDRCTLFTECNQGQAVIKKRFGYPIYNGELNHDGIGSVLL